MGINIGRSQADYAFDVKDSQRSSQEHPNSPFTFFLLRHINILFSDYLLNCFICPYLRLFFSLHYYMLVSVISCLLFCCCFKFSSCLISLFVYSSRIYFSFFVLMDVGITHMDSATLYIKTEK